MPPSGPDRAPYESATADDGLSSHVQVAVEEFIHQHHPGLEDDLESLNDGHDGHAAVLKIFGAFLARDTRVLE